MQLICFRIIAAEFNSPLTITNNSIINSKQNKDFASYYADNLQLIALLLYINQDFKGTVRFLIKHDALLFEL